MAVAIFSCSHAPPAQLKPPFKFEGLTLAQGTYSKDGIALPDHPADVYNTRDKQVIAHLSFRNLSGSYRLRWDWYDPDGNLYYSTGDFPFKASQGKFAKQATTWHSLSVKGDKAETLPGKWQVKVFLNNEQIAAKGFELKEAADLVDLPAGLSQKPYPKDWGLIIGIEDYAQLPKVEYARKDALIMREYFQKILGIPEENIIMMIDGDATKARIEGYIAQYIPANVNRDTTLYVYFAGHGAPDMKKGEPYLIPYDGDTRFIEQTGYALKKFYEDLQKLNVQRTYVFIDSCFSGMASRAAEMLAKGARPALLHVENIQLKTDKVIAFSASDAGQTSNAYPETEHGLFTYYLLRAMSGEADADDDHWISIKEIYSYVSDHVSRMARRLGEDQTPILTPSINTVKDIAIIKVVR